MTAPTVTQPKPRPIRRITDADALAMYEELSLVELGRLAHEACAALHPEPYRTYVVDRNINYSNICTAHCTFCNFKMRPGSPSAYVLSRDELAAKIDELVAIGLDTIPGGGAEILVDRVRDRISVGKVRTEEYLEVMRQAHLIGMRTSVTMMFGHIETVPERIEHFRRIRELQEETDGFTAFIPWTFQPIGTALGRTPSLPPDRPRRPDGKHLVLANAQEYLKTLCLARLYLDNVSNVQASWVTQGPDVGQLALFFGANDMGSVMMEENVVSAAGTTYRLGERDIRRLIADAGWRPCRRNCYYEPLE